MNASQQTILSTLSQSPMLVRDLETQMPISKRMTRYHLAQLVRDGRVEKFVDDGNLRHVKCRVKEMQR